MSLGANFLSPAYCMGSYSILLIRGLYILGLPGQVECVCELILKNGRRWTNALQSRDNASHAAHAGSTLRSFRYHLSIGFDNIFLFDDTCDPSLPVCLSRRAGNRACALSRPRGRLRRRCSLWATLGRFYAEEVQARQSIPRLAVQLALDPSSARTIPTLELMQAGLARWPVPSAGSHTLTRTSSFTRPGRP